MSSSSSSSRGKNALVRIRDFSMYHELISEMKRLSTEIKSKRSENLSQSDIRVLEIQLSKIQDSFSKHLYSNVRVMKPLEKQFSVKETKEPKDDKLEEKVTNYHRKMMEIVVKVNSHKKKVMEILQNNNLNYADLGKFKEECQKLSLDFEKLNEPIEQKSLEDINKDQFGAISWNSEEIDTEISKFTKNYQYLSTELGTVHSKLVESEKTIELLSNNESYDVKEEEKQALRKAITSSGSQASSQLAQIIASQQTINSESSSQPIISSSQPPEQNRTPKKKKKKKKPDPNNNPSNSQSNNTVKTPDHKRKGNSQQPQSASKKQKQ